MLRSCRNIFHLIRIAFILARYRALFPLEHIRIFYLLFLPLKLIPARNISARKGERLAMALEALGPSFIKLGQTLSTRSDLIGKEVATDLSRLQDRLPPFPTNQAIAIIEHELENSLQTLFSDFNQEPVAAASIAQVHQATTTEGKKVAVKVLRPGIREAFARDIDLLFWLATLAEKNIKSLKRLRPVEVIHIFAKTVKLEMDLRFEAAAASELKENCKNDTNFYVPEVDWTRTSRNVFTLEWVDGIPINDTQALIEAGHDLNNIASTLAVSFFNQAYRDGFFHGDLHPGNLFVSENGTVIVVDFGIMGRLDTKTRIYVAEILRGFLNKDYLHVAQVHFDAGYVPDSKSLETFAQACRSIGEPIIGLSVNNISIARLLSQLFEITEDFEMETQPQLLLLQKTMVLVEGVGAMLNPNVNMWKLAEPWIEEWVIQNMGVEARLRTHGKDVLHFMANFPTFIKDAHALYSQVRTDGLKLHPHTIRAIVQEEQKATTGTFSRIILAAIIGAGLMALALRIIV